MVTLCDISSISQRPEAVCNDKLCIIGICEDHFMSNTSDLEALEGLSLPHSSSEQQV